MEGKIIHFLWRQHHSKKPADFLSVSRDHRTGRGSSEIRSTFFDTLVRSIFDVVESVMIAIK